MTSLVLLCHLLWCREPTLWFKHISLRVRIMQVTAQCPYCPLPITPTVLLPSGSGIFLFPPYCRSNSALSRYPLRTAMHNGVAPARSFESTFAPCLSRNLAT
ncbi:hypothetical protein N431DRAFT_204573 [Stipitochalara longipes BDJ]|nr:hypothetical protein N431DRAFT_204573 [Stipitochalara longipes BDJ]